MWLSNSYKKIPVLTLLVCPPPQIPGGPVPGGGAAAGPTSQPFPIPVHGLKMLNRQLLLLSSVVFNSRDEIFVQQYSVHSPYRGNPRVSFFFCKDLQFSRLGWFFCIKKRNMLYRLLDLIKLNSKESWLKFFLKQTTFLKINKFKTKFSKISNLCH